MHCGIEMGLRQRLAEFEVALIEEFVPWNSHPVDVSEPTPDADTRAVLGVVQLGRRDTTAPQLREWRLLVLAGAFDVHGRVPRDPALAL